jgi:single-strand selective monofunctional uracil DNA glycosylase
LKDLVQISRRLADSVDSLHFALPVTHVYNPLSYARATHEEYLEKYGCFKPEAVLVGMNPGPYGMAQTGVPFGEIQMVKEWLRIEGKIQGPEGQHPKRPIQGFDCSRSEVSGSRLWSWARESFGRPEKFFQRFMVLNYCPLCFMEDSGRNRTPDKLPVAEREPLFAACDLALKLSIQQLQPQYVIGIGAFAAKRIKAALPDSNLIIGQILHPSPASPKANKGWAQQVTRELETIGIKLQI